VVDLQRKDVSVCGCGNVVKKGCECALLCCWCAWARATRIKRWVAVVNLQRKDVSVCGCRELV